MVQALTCLACTYQEFMPVAATVLHIDEELLLCIVQEHGDKEFPQKQSSLQRAVLLR
jgi:hypothetical protein